jgi:acyl-CoA synthetase (AMP-forming)/AMP-acid ligase II
MENYFASFPSQKVTILRSEKLKNHKEALTLPQLFDEVVKYFPWHLALRCGSLDLTYQEYFQRSEKMAKSFIKIGLERSGCVAIFADNCHKTFIAQLATSFAG